MSTTVSELVLLCRPYIGDSPRKTTSPDDDLAWDNESLAALAPSAMALTIDGGWPQEYEAGSSLTSEITPDPATGGDVEVLALFLAKTALLSEQGRWARRAVTHSNAAGSTSTRHIAGAIAEQLKYIDQEIERAASTRTRETIAGEMTIRELSTAETTSSAPARHTREL